MLELRELVKHYRVGAGEPICAVDRVSMTVAAGEFVALYGPSGSGKTTLLDLIAGLRWPDSGTVCVAGRDIFALSRRESDEYRLRQVGIIGQPHNLIPGARVMQNASLKLLLANERRSNSRIEPLLERLGLAERMWHRTEQLSMGERQRVLIAMALSLRAEARTRGRADGTAGYPAHSGGAVAVAGALPRAGRGDRARDA